jgi:hypothetical protein
MVRLWACVCAAALLGTVAVVVSSPPADAGALPPCPTVMSNITLTSDCLAPLNVNQDGVTVNLGGRTVDCGGNAIGINVVNRTGVRIKNGTVTGCSARGIFLHMGGNHRVTSVNLVDNDHTGIFVGSAGSRVTFIRASSNSTFGIDVASANNRIANNHVQHNGNGIFLNSVNADQNLVVSNRALANGIGIQASGGAEGNTITFNVALFNTLFDVADTNAACDTNTWFFNLYATEFPFVCT